MNNRFQVQSDDQPPPMPPNPTREELQKWQQTALMWAFADRPETELVREMIQIWDRMEQRGQVRPFERQPTVPQNPSN